MSGFFSKISLANRRRILISVLICLWPMVIGLLAGWRFPDQVPIHFDFQGTPDNWMSKSAFFYGFPWFFVGMDAFVLVLTFREEKNRPGNPVLESVLMWLVPLIEGIAIGGCMLFALYPHFQIERFIPGALGLLMLVLGNLAPKARQNGTFGFRNAYTLSSRKVWAKVNRLAGYLLCLNGVMFLTGTFFAQQLGIVVTALLVVDMVLTIGLWMYSKNLYQQPGMR